MAAAKRGAQRASFGGDPERAGTASGHDRPSLSDHGRTRAATQPAQAAGTLPRFAQPAIDAADASPVHSHGRRSLRSRIAGSLTPHVLALALLSGSIAVGGLAASPPAASASSIKVVVIVGPVASETARYIGIARDLAAQARSYGARVYEIYSPNATWSRVVSVSQGANLLIYLGHGNGWPSPYGPFSAERKDGFGLNAVAGHGNANQVYYGEARVAQSIRLAPNAVVLLNHLCYASGNAEWGSADPSRSVAIRRVDNYGAGFLRAGAAAVVADGLNTPSYILRGLFTSSSTLESIFWSSESSADAYTIRFGSQRTPGARAIMDPYRPDGYYRSIIGRLGVTAAEWR